MKLVFNPTTGNLDYVASTPEDVGLPGLATNITAGKTLTLVATDNYSLTVPTTGTAALLGTANVFTAVQKINVNDTLALLVEQDGVKDNTFVVDTTNGRVGVNTVPTNFMNVNGTMTQTTVDENGMSIDITLNPTGGTTSRRYKGLNGSLTYVGSGASTVRSLSGFTGIFINNSSTGSVFLCAGLTGRIQFDQATSTGTIGYGILSEFPFMQPGATLDNYMGYYCQTATTITGINNYYGLYFDDINDGITSNYAIYSKAGLIRFGDQVNIVGSADRNQLIVNGFTTQTNPLAHFIDATSTNNATKEVHRIEARVSSTGVGAAGLGPAFGMYAETATNGTYQAQAIIASAWVDATNTTRKAKMSLSAYDTAQRLGIEIEASGSAAKLGFFGVTPVVQPANNAAIDTLLSNLGLRASGGESFFDTRLMLPMGEISYFSITGTAITIAAQSDGSTNMVVVNPTTSLNNDKDFDNGGSNNGRLRYTGTTTRTFHVACTISISPALANDTFVFGVAKGGAVIASSRVPLQATTASGIRSTALHVMVSLATNEYLELYVGNTTDADDCTVHSINLFAMGM